MLRRGGRAILILLLLLLLLLLQLAQQLFRCFNGGLLVWLGLICAALIGCRRLLFFRLLNVLSVIGIRFFDGLVVVDLWHRLEVLLLVSRVLEPRICARWDLLSRLLWGIGLRPIHPRHENNFLERARIGRRSQ